MRLFLFVLAIAVFATSAAFHLTRQNFVRSSVHMTAGEAVGHYEELKVPTLKGIYFADITPEVRRIVKDSGVKTGVVSILSRHTTTAITINEMEGRLVDDARQYLLKLAPAAYPYLHNDLHLRSGPPDWPGGDEAWRVSQVMHSNSSATESPVFTRATGIETCIFQCCDIAIE